MCYISFGQQVLNEPTKLLQDKSPGKNWERGLMLPAVQLQGAATTVTLVLPPSFCPLSPGWGGGTISVVEITCAQSDPLISTHIYSPRHLPMWTASIPTNHSSVQVRESEESSVAWSFEAPLNRKPREGFFTFLSSACSPCIHLQYPQFLTSATGTLKKGKTWTVTHPLG